MSTGCLPPAARARAHTHVHAFTALLSWWTNYLGVSWHVIRSTTPHVMPSATHGSRATISSLSPRAHARRTLSRALLLPFRKPCPGRAVTCPADCRRGAKTLQGARSTWPCEGQGASSAKIKKRDFEGIRRPIGGLWLSQTCGYCSTDLKFFFIYIVPNICTSIQCIFIHF